MRKNFEKKRKPKLKNLEKREKLAKIINIVLPCLLLPFVVLFGYLFPNGKLYYVAAAVVIASSIIMFYASFEKSETKSREIAVIASMTAIAVISRAAFSFAPQMKPIGAVVMTAAVSFGYEAGFMIGSLSMFLSNIIFGHGIWTPFQMLGMGLSGLVCGLIFSSDKANKVKNNRFSLGLICGAVIMCVYGPIVDTSSALLVTTDFSSASVLAVYISGLPYNAIFGATTAVVMILFGNSFTVKLERLKTKYGIFLKNEAGGDEYENKE